MAENIIFTGTGDVAADRLIQRRAAADQLRKIAQGVYTDNLKDPLETVTLRNVFKIAAHSCGPALLFGQSAFVAGPVMEGHGPSRHGWLFLIDPRLNRRRDMDLPGLSIRSMPGLGPSEGDYPHLGLTMPSRPRMLLENLIQSRSRDGKSPKRTSGASEVERKLEKLCATEGEEKLNQIRDEARTLAKTLHLEAEFEKLDEIIGALLGTRKAKLTSPTAIARAQGTAYDADCVNRLTVLKRHLGEVALPESQDRSTAMDSKVSTCFMEAYFSNYIEGTRFPILQAGRIIFENERPERRPKDSHDIVSTFNQLVNLGTRLPSSLGADEFCDEILARHSELMSARPEALPGKWKQDANVAGSTTFVLPAYVEGTLRAGIDMLSGISHPFARAIFIQFLLSDVHPFTDGNGRISRIMMTKELVGSGFSRTIIPTVYRENYLGALRDLTRHGKPDALVRAMTFCQKVTAACAASPVERAIEVWASTFAFVDEGSYARLAMPDPARRVVWREEVPAPEEYWQTVDNPDSGSGFSALFQKERQNDGDKSE